MEKIFVLGKALWDVILETEVELKENLFCFPFKEKTLAKSLVQEPGGGALNTSLAFKKLGFEPIPLAVVGKDFLGEEIRERLKEEGITTKFIGSTHKHTGTSVVVLGKKGLHTALIYPGANKELEADDIDTAALKEARWWLILSWGNVNEEIIKEIVNKKEKLGKHLVFNPGKIQLQYPEKLKSLLAVTDILIVNKQELFSLVGRGKSLSETLVKAVGWGPKIVVATLGRQGSIVYDGGYFYRTPVYPAAVVDSLGCGDAFTSAFLAWFIKTGKIEQAVLAGTINSASVVSERGTVAGQLTDKEISKKIANAEIKVKKEKVSQ